MKNIIRLTENDLHNVIINSVRKILKEDVLGNDWQANEEENVLNNYQPFDDQIQAYEDEGINQHDWGIKGEEGLDPTLYDDTHREPLGWNDDEAEGYEEDPDWDLRDREDLRDWSSDGKFA